MTTLMKIGDLAKQTGLSVRTLHHYDDIGLLTPTRRTAAGHRLYGAQDIMRLQQILSLRQLGFSLAEVSECLESPDFSLPKVIDLHCDRLRQQIDASRTLLQRLNHIAHDLQTTQSVAVAHLIEAMEAMTMTTQYLTPTQQTLLASRFEEISAEWHDMLALARNVMSEGTDFSSVKARALAQYWQRTMKALVGGDKEMFEAIARLYQQEGGNAASLGHLDVDTFDYILKAVAFSTLAQDMPTQFSTQNYTPTALQVIELGEAAARDLHLDVVGTEALLLGLLAEGSSPAAQLLARSGMTLTATQSTIARLLEPQPIAVSEMPPSTRLPLAPRAQRVLELAHDQVQLFGQSHVTPDFLLLGMLLETEEIEIAGHSVGVAARVLREAYELEITDLKQQLLATIARV